MNPQHPEPQSGALPLSYTHRSVIATAECSIGCAGPATTLAPVVRLPVWLLSRVERLVVLETLIVHGQQVTTEVPAKVAPDTVHVVGVALGVVVFD